MPRIFSLLLLVSALGAGCATDSTAVQTSAVQQLDLDQYLGTWFEIAKYPQPFQRGCTCTTARYERRDAEEIRVVNRCRKGDPSGDVKVADGRATVPNAQEEPGKLRVSFFGPFAADYWVIERGAPVRGSYPWAVVSNADGSTLWILSRTPTLDEDVYQGILADLGAKGFDLARLDETVQRGCWTERDGRLVERTSPVR